MNTNIRYVVTTINEPNDNMTRLAQKAAGHRGGESLIVVADEKTPIDWSMEYATVLDTTTQRNMRVIEDGFVSATKKYYYVPPKNHYARKNVGYLYAAAQGAHIIRETDDDNNMFERFYDTPQVDVEAMGAVQENDDWVNVYSFWTRLDVWPRGLPWEKATNVVYHTNPGLVHAPIQQGLVMGDTDVDAVYRRLKANKVNANFRNVGYPLALSHNWSPFNSQATTWFREAFPLMYLPQTCTMRACDIIRSYVAQRIAYAKGWSILYHGPVGVQVRNAHDLYDDFEQELVLYRHAISMRDALLSVPISTRTDFKSLRTEMLACYAVLASCAYVEQIDVLALDLWLEDLRAHGYRA